MRRYMDALAADRIPDPTTAGDFTRRFAEQDVLSLMEAINALRPKIWKKRLRGSDDTNGQRWTHH